MAVTADTLRRLGKLRLAPEALEEVLAIIADIQSVDEDRKAKQRERTAKHRSMQRDRNVTVTAQQRDPSPKDINQTPNHVSSPTDPDGSVAPKGARTARKPRNRALPVDWQPGERSERVRVELGRNVEWMHRTAAAMRTWAESKGELRADWDATHDGWMRRDAERERQSGGNVAPFDRQANRSGNGTGSNDLFAGRSAGGGRAGTSGAAIAAAMARRASCDGVGSGGWEDRGRSEDGRDRPSGRDDPSIEDADWSPAPRYSSAH